MSGDVAVVDRDPQQSGQMVTSDEWYMACT